jgi:hypothetical protein
MDHVTSKTDRLIALADAAIAAAQRERAAAGLAGKSWLVDDCDRAISNFQAIRERAATGELPASRGAGLGISRALGEWNVSSSFYAAGKALEDFCRGEYGA